MRLTTIPIKIGAIPQLVRNSTRAVEVVSVLSKYGLADWVSRLDLKLFRDLFKSNSGDRLTQYSREQRVRLALIELGPTFIKLGQVLSTRPDVVGVRLAEELAYLQDETPADPPAVVRELVESELGEPIAQLFLSFDERPLASASIGQVHRAQLRGGEQVVVKVQHPGIDAKIRTDLDILVGLAELAERVPEFKNYRPRALAAEFQRTLLRELDFGREERHMLEFAANFADDPRISIPTAYPDYSTGRVLTMQWLDGIKLTERTRLAEAHLDLEEIARRGADLYMQMIFIHGVYHADPHPGNLLLLEGNVIGLLDFGMVGRIDEALREEIEELLLAIANRDAGHLTSILVRLGQAPPDLDRAALSVDVSDFVSTYTNQPLSDFDLGGALRDMTEMVRRYGIMLPARVAMLIKVLIMLEGTARLLTPRFRLIDVIVPYQRKMYLRRLSPRRQMRKLMRFYRELELLAETLPRHLKDILEQVQSGRFDVHLDHRGLEPSVNRLVLGLLTSALLLGSTLLWSQNVPPRIYGIPVFGVAGYAVSIGLGLRLLRAINKSGHLDRRQ